MTIENLNEPPERWVIDTFSFEIKLVKEDWYQALFPKYLLSGRLAGPYDNHELAVEQSHIMIVQKIKEYEFEIMRLYKLLDTDK
jgi:hypothetical protein